MRTRGLSLRLVAAVLCALQAAVAVLGGAMVRCVEADGSTSIEWIVAGCCDADDPAGDGSAAGGPRADASDQDCFGCEDQSLAGATANHAPRSTVARAASFVPPDPGTALPFPAWPGASLPTVAGPLDVRTPSPPPGLAAIRSTVLRC